VFAHTPLSWICPPRLAGCIEVKMKAFRIKNFSHHYENGESRKIKRPAWVAIPINFDSDGFIEMQENPDGPSIYAVWICLVGLAMIGKPISQRTGILDRKSGQYPHDIRTISRKIRMKESLVKKALVLLVDKIGWVEIVDFESKELIPGGTRTLSGQDPEGRGGEGKEGEGNEKKSSPPFGDGTTELYLSQKLSVEIIQVSPGSIITNSQIQAWAKDVDLMLRTDKRTEKQIKDLIHWIFEDDFWKNQIRSMGTLRKKWQEGIIPKERNTNSGTQPNKTIFKSFDKPKPKDEPEGETMRPEDWAEIKKLNKGMSMAKAIEPKEVSKTK